MKLLYCGSGWLPMVDAIRARLPPGATIRARDFGRPLVDEVRDVQVLLPSNAPIDAETIAAATDLRLIQQPAVGFEGVDLCAARHRGVPVCHAPATNSDAVAQAALLLILALARRLGEARRAFARARIGEPLGHELGGKVLGLIGRGRSASCLSRAAEALGMVVVSVDSKSSRAELEALLARADFVSIHCPLTPRTRGLLGAPELALMKRGAYLVNCARGPIVDRAALEAALASGHLGGAGLDVFWEEPWDPADPLWARPDVVTLPHVAGSTVEAFARIADIVAENVRRLLTGEPLLYRVA